MEGWESIAADMPPRAARSDLRYGAAAPTQLRGDGAVRWRAAPRPPPRNSPPRPRDGSVPRGGGAVLWPAAPWPPPYTAGRSQQPAVRPAWRRRRCCGAAARYNGELPPRPRPRHSPRPRDGSADAAAGLLRGTLESRPPAAPRNCWPLTTTCCTGLRRGRCCWADLLARLRRRRR